jgi:hypothetical protein
VLSFSLTKDAEHLDYLSSAQALGDFVELIQFLKKTPSGAEESPVIAFGGSYGGNIHLEWNSQLFVPQLTN